MSDPFDGLSLEGEGEGWVHVNEPAGDGGGPEA